MPMSAGEVRQALRELDDLRYSAGNLYQALRRIVLAEQLQRALDARVVIEQAKGALVAREGLSEQEAFERLRRQARRP
jgi:AmiR/NasT family two-component response regulator